MIILFKKFCTITFHTYLDLVFELIFKEKTTPNVKKRHHRRIKSNGVKSSASSFLQSSNTHENVNGGSADDSGGSCGGLAANATNSNSDSNNFEFHIVSLDNKQWHFEASSCEERDEWVSAIEQQILNTLQVCNNEISNCFEKGSIYK